MDVGSHRVAMNCSRLPSVEENTVLACLRERYLADQPYTAVGSSTLISLNPFKHLSINDDRALKSYADEYKIGEGFEPSSEGATETGLPPHIYKLAIHAYYHMKRTGQDQSILIR